jgi:CRISPR-associated protein Cas6
MSKVDVCFGLSGRSVPLDHGYALYAALCRQVPQLHDKRWLAIHPLAGHLKDKGILELRPGAELRLRVPVINIPELMPLIGASLDVAGYPLLLGSPTIRTLSPSRSLDARLVAIKVTNPTRLARPEDGRQVLDAKSLQGRFEAEAKRQLDRLQVRGELAVQGRRSIQVAGRHVIGFSVRITGLSETDSLRVQEDGLGGKPSMGCGIFRPTRSQGA